MDDECVMSDQRTAETARWVTNAGRHQHQSILPWLWDILTDEDVKRIPTCVPSHPVPVVITAGPEGASLLVCPSAAEEAAAATAAAGATPTKAESMLLPASPSPVPNVTAKMGPPALTSGAAAAAAAAGTEIGAATNLARISGGSTGAAAAAVSPGPTGRAAQLVNRQQQNPLVRRSLAAAAAADSVMSPRPGSNLRQASSANLASASRDPPLADRAPSILRNLGRNSPTIRELGRVSPLRLGSVSPLPGAMEDNLQYIGTDRRHSGSLGQPDDQHATVPATSAVDASQHADGHTDDEVSAAAERPAAAAAGIRRSRSQRPLKPWGSMRGRDT